MNEIDRYRLEQKKNRLETLLKQYGALLVAFSGGVDSTFLLAVAHGLLKQNVLAVTAASPVHPSRETADAIAIAKDLGVEHIVVQAGEMNLPDFTANTKDRCYVCKKNILEDLLRIAEKRGIRHVAHGANVDDGSDYRPGARAAMEMGIVAPLNEAGLTKDEIRRLSKEMNLDTWNKPAMACLATRIPYGTEITAGALKMVEQAEDLMLKLGFGACRVRVHGGVARIEVRPENIERIADPSVRGQIVREFREIGFAHIAVDLEGYVQGSMNRTIQDSKQE